MSNDEPSDDLAVWLRRRRAELQLRQIDVAVRAGVSRFTVSRIEHGHHTHPLVAAAIRRALGKDQSDAS
jgi:DNA-binding XRE family transcriptional regulator